MKYLVVLCDGMADEKNSALGGKTPMECAKKPNIDALARVGICGLCRGASSSTASKIWSSDRNPINPISCSSRDIYIATLINREYIFSVGF